MVDNTLIPAPPAARLGPGRRIYVVGDVHGHRATLDQVHATIRTDLRDRPVAEPALVHLGDLIDRGPDSAGCIELLARGSPIAGVPTVTLMGNHEWMMLRAMQGGSYEDIDRWLDNGGDRALHSWGLRSSQKPAEWLAGLPDHHLAFLKGLGTSWVSEGYAFVHAGVRPGIPLAAQRDMDLMWIRETFLAWPGTMLPEAPARVVVHGHTPEPEPVLRPNRIGLDTGAGRGGPLTCAVLEGNGLGLFQH